MGTQTKSARLCAFHPHTNKALRARTKRERDLVVVVFYSGKTMMATMITTTTFQTQSSVYRNRGALASSPNAKKILVVGKTAAPRHKKTSIRFDVRANGGISRDAEQMAGLGGDFGARDPTAGEIGSNFGTSTTAYRKEHKKDQTTATGEKVVVEVHTKEVKGLTINDFIVATKIEADEEIAGMIVKKAKAVRNWA